MASPRHRRQQPEHALQTALVQHLRLRARPDVLWFHVANQRKADARTGAILKRMGALAGVSDLLLFRPSECGHCSGKHIEAFALEVKAPGGRPTEAQLEFMARFSEAGGHTCIAEGLDRALAVLDAWGIFGRRQ
jgi:hypothetical protein